MDDISEHQLAQLSKTVADKMERLKAQVPNGAQACVLQLALCEMESLKDLLFNVGGPLEGYGAEHAYEAMSRFVAWADDMQSAITRAKILRGGNGHA